MPKVKKTREVKLKGPLHRMFPIEAMRQVRAEGEPDESALFEITLSTEEPCEMTTWVGKRFVEVLGHSREEVDMSYFDAGGAGFVDHKGDQIGVTEKAWIADRKLKALVRFSRSTRGQEVRQDVEDKIRRFVSVGYDPKKYKPISTDADGMETVRAVWWTPLEWSVTGIPADLGAGFGRAKTEERELLVAIEGDEPVTEDMKMKKVRGDTGTLIEVPDDDPRPAATEAVTEQSTRSLGAAAVEDKPSTRQLVREMCERNGMPQYETDLIAKHGDNVTLQQAAAAIMEHRSTNGKAQDSEETIRGIPRNLAADYSYTRAIRSLVELKEGGPRTSTTEWQVHERLLKEMPETYASKGGMLVPISLGLNERGQRGQRVMGSKEPFGGASAVQEEVGEFIDLLRPRSRVIEMGARVLTGLKGPIAWPKQTEDVVGYWMAENPPAPVPDSEVKLGTILMSPRTVMSTVPIPRQLIMQSSIDIERLVKESMASRHTRMIDRAAIHGTGTAGEPKGVYKTDDVNQVAMGGIPTHAKLVSMASVIVDLEADLGTQQYLTTPLMAGVLASTPIIPNVWPFHWGNNLRDGTLVGYPAKSSTQVSKTMSTLEPTGGSQHGIIFGSWSEMVVGLWGIMELIVDPYTLARWGQVRITSFQMCDVVVLRPEAFTVSTGATIV